MQKRNTQQRRRAIVTQLAERGELSVDWLAREFDTSEVTIRKDLAELERNGLLLRRYGGAIPVPQELVADVPEAEQVSKRKLAIAKAAAELIRDHNRLIIDSGSTTAALIPELGSRRGLVVMTNSLTVAAALRELENEPTLLMTGGTWDPHSEAFQGQVAEQVHASGVGVFLQAAALAKGQELREPGPLALRCQFATRRFQGGAVAAHQLTGPLKVGAAAELGL